MHDAPIAALLFVIDSLRLRSVMQKTYKEEMRIVKESFVAIGLCQ